VVTIVLNWNGGADTLQCLEALSCVETPGWDHVVLVVDNGSTDDSVRMIEDSFPALEVLRNGENLGFAEGMNRGIRWATDRAASHVLLLNNDAIVRPDSIVRLLSADDGRTGAVVPVVRHASSGDVWHAGGRVIRPFGRIVPRTAVSTADPFPTEVFSACCVLFPMRVLDEVGGFDARYYLYIEDTDLAMRIRRAGYGIRVVPAAVVDHKVSRSSGGATSPAVTYYLVRNNLLFWRDWSANRAEYILGALYMMILSLKMVGNALVRRGESTRQVFTAVRQGWADYAAGCFGPRRT